MGRLNFYTTETHYNTSKENFDYPTVAYVEETEEVKWMTKPADPYNGYEHVDLGLPSGTIWATKNVGASTETDGGLYFAWGETTGYAIESDGNDGYTIVGNKTFSWNDYAFGAYDENDSPDYGMTKYNNTDDKTKLELTDDAAAVNMGGLWHMPTTLQMRELILNTKNGIIDDEGIFTEYSWSNFGNNTFGEPTETTISIGNKFGGVAGFLFFKNSVTISNALSNNEYIFIPLSGVCESGASGGQGMSGVILTNTRAFSDSNNLDNIISAIFASFRSDSAFIDSYIRCNGYCVRGVVSPDTTKLYLEDVQRTILHFGVGEISTTQINIPINDPANNVIEAEGLNQIDIVFPKTTLQLEISGYRGVTLLHTSEKPDVHCYYFFDTAIVHNGMYESAIYLNLYYAETTETFANIQNVDPNDITYLARIHVDTTYR